MALPTSSEKRPGTLLEARQAFLNDAGGNCMEEASSSVQLLLCPKGHRSHPNIPVLLRRDPIVRHGP